MSMLKWFAAFAAVLALLFAILSLYGRWRWERSTGALFERLDAARSDAARRAPTRAHDDARYDPRELDGLPPPVQRYFRTALREGAPIVRGVELRHRGTFNADLERERWLPFVSHQRVTTSPPGFVWDGRVRMSPGVATHVHDAYIAGEGFLHPALFGVFSLADLHGRGAVAEGELMRWFAEAAWYPTALLPSQGVRWQAIDERSARATLRDGEIELSLTFVFGDDGMTAAVRADARGRTVGDRVVPTPWEGVWSVYRDIDGMRVPTTGDVAWLLPEGRKSYWRGTIEEVRYEYAH